MTILNSLLLESEKGPEVLLVQKHIWLNFKSDDATPIGWQTKQGMHPHSVRGLMAGDLLVGYYESKGIPNYKLVISNGEVVKNLSPEFLKKELNELIASKVLKVLLK